MKNTNLIPNCRINHDIYVRENRLVYQEAASERLKESMANILDSAAKLLDLTTRVASKATDLLEKGIALGESGVRKLKDWVEDPGKPEKLLEYAELRDSNHPNYIPRAASTGNDNIDIAMEGYRRMVFLGVKIDELNAFQKPFLDEFQKVESMRKEIYRRNQQNSDEITKLEREVARRENALKENTLLRTDPRRAQMEAELASYKAGLEKLKSHCSYILEWDKPLYEETEFPRSSGKYVDRFVVDSSTKVKIDIKQLYRWMEEHSDNEYADLLEKYEDEMEKLDYHSQRIINTTLPYLTPDEKEDVTEKIKAAKKTLDEAGKKAKSTIGSGQFTKNGTKKDIIGLDLLDKSSRYDTYRQQRQEVIKGL